MEILKKEIGIFAVKNCSKHGKAKGGITLFKRNKVIFTFSESWWLGLCQKGTELVKYEFMSKNQVTYNVSWKKFNKKWKNQLYPSFDQILS